MLDVSQALTCKPTASWSLCVKRQEETSLSKLWARCSPVIAQYLQVVWGYVEHKLELSPLSKRSSAPLAELWQWSGRIVLRASFFHPVYYKINQIDILQFDSDYRWRLDFLLSPNWAVAEFRSVARLSVWLGIKLHCAHEATCPTFEQGSFSKGRGFRWLWLLFNLSSDIFWRNHTNLSLCLLGLITDLSKYTSDQYLRHSGKVRNYVIQHWYMQPCYLK